MDQSEYEGFFSYIWDRGAYGALPFELRVKYAQLMLSLLDSDIHYILEGYFYDSAHYPGSEISINNNF